MEAQTDALLRRAVAAGDSATVALIEGEGPPGVATIRVPVPRRRPARDRALARDGVTRLREAGCDCVLAIRHVHECEVYFPRGGLVGDAVEAADRARGGASLLRRAARALSGKHRFFLQAEEALLGRPEGPRVIALSRGLAARIASRYPASSRRIVVVPNGVDAARFAPGPFAAARDEVRARLELSRSLVGLLVAHNPRLKGLETVLLALASPEVAAIEPPVRVLVLGRTPDRGLRRLARSLRVAEAVRFHPPTDDPRPLYAAADLLLHPTWHDPCSNACLEALAMGLPVVTTPRNGAAELMGARGGVVLEEPGNPEALACAVRVLAEPALRAQTAEIAREVALENPMTRRLDEVLAVCRSAARPA
jgi:UDP-glucose:(heptosyl)LPS alpha-1,3-glucosyltransferase